MDLSELWRVAQGGGPVAILLLLSALYWLNEDRKTIKAERDKLQDQKDALNERTINVAHDATIAIRELRDMLFHGAEKHR